MQQVLRDEKSGLYRIWYNCFLKYRTENGVAARYPLLYAESDDGLNWIRPKLGLLEYAGSKDNKFIILGAWTAGVFVEPDASDPQRRYKALVWHEPDFVNREVIFCTRHQTEYTGKGSSIIRQYRI